MSLAKKSTSLFFSNGSTLTAADFCSCSDVFCGGSSSRCDYCSECGGCSCFGTSLCSCSIHTSCHYSHTATTTDFTTSSEGTFGDFCRPQNDTLTAALPQLLQLPAAPRQSMRRSSPAPATMTMQRPFGDVCALGGALRPPQMSSPCGVPANIAAQNERDGHEKTGRRSVGTSTPQQTITTTTTTRATSPHRACCADAACNTDVIWERWEEQRRDTMRRLTFLQEQISRYESLEKRHTSVELALLSAHERLKEKEERETAVMLNMTTIKKELRCEVEQMELIYRQYLLDQEEDARLMLNKTIKSCKHAVLMTEEVQKKNEKLLQGAVVLSQVGNYFVNLFFSFEEWHRNGIYEAERQSCSFLWHMFDFLKSYQHELSCKAYALEHAEEQKFIAITAKETAERQLHEALINEKELRIQYLHALRLPTTAIVSCGHCSNATGNCCGSGGDIKKDDNNISVHARFARAHKEAVEAVRAQRRCVVGGARLF